MSSCACSTPDRDTQAGGAVRRGVPVRPGHRHRLMASAVLQEPRKLEKADDRSAFSSAADELDQWFGKYAWENLAARNAITYVTTGNEQIVGYYAICSGGVGKQYVPNEFGRGRPTTTPCILLARLAIDSRFQGKSIGRHLFRDAIARAITASEAIGAACLLIHARDEAAKTFYLKNADLLQSPVKEMHLILPMKAARKPPRNSAIAPLLHNADR